jgi:hypothetical protein
MREHQFLRFIEPLVRADGEHMIRIGDRFIGLSSRWIIFELVIFEDVTAVIRLS